MSRTGRINNVLRRTIINTSTITDRQSIVTTGRTAVRMPSGLCETNTWETPLRVMSPEHSEPLDPEDEVRPGVVVGRDGEEDHGVQQSPGTEPPKSSRESRLRCAASYPGIGGIIGDADRRTIDNWQLLGWCRIRTNSFDSSSPPAPA